MSDDPIKGDSILQDVPEYEGFKFLDPCVVLAPLGKGGMGAVYHGTHVELEIDVAIKCLRPDLSGDEVYVKRFKREAQIAARVNHKNLIRVYAVRETNNVHYIVMEFVEGENAAQRVERKGPLRLEEAVTIVREAAEGLAEAHRQGIVHRDIKPENILISSRGEVKVADLGLSKNSRTDGMTLTREAVLGTPAYMPPEQFTDFKNLGAPADVYSLGATLYYLLTGEKLYTGAHLAELWHQKTVEPYPEVAERIPGISAELAAILRRCGAIEPGERFADAGELAAALGQVSPRSTPLKDPAARTSTTFSKSRVSPPPAKTLLTIRQQAYGPAPGDPCGGRRSRRSAWVAAGLLFLAAFSGAAYWQFTRRDETPDVLAETAPRATAVEEGTTRGAAADVAAPDDDEPRGATADVERRTVSLATLEADLRRASAADELLGVIERLAKLRGETTLEPPEAAKARKLHALALRRAAQWAEEARQYRRALEHFRRSLAVDDVALTRHFLEKLEKDIRTDLGQGLEIARPATPLSAVPFLLTGTTGSKLVEKVLVATASAVPVAGRFELMVGVGLDDGSHRLPVTLLGPEGIRSEAAPVEVLIDRAPPEIVIATPDDGARVGTTVRVEGAVRELTLASLTVNGADVGVAADGSWSAALTLEGGERTIVVEAADRAGHATVAARSVLVDTSGPVITVASPPADWLTSATEVQVQGSVKDAAATIVLVAGVRTPLDANGAFRRTVPLETDGERTIVVEARDGLGNSATVSVRVRRDARAPEVTWTADGDGSSFVEGTATLRGSVEDDSPPVRVRVNGRDALVDGDSWSIEMDLARGKPRLEVVATDALGNESAPLVRSLSVSPRGFSFLRENAQGHVEYRHERSGITFVLLAGGEFAMGSPDGERGRGRDEGPLHRVTLSPFLIAKHEVSQAEWKRVMGSEPADFEGAKLPVETVTWNECADFCKRTGLDLPSEAQWEFACRGGAAGPFAFGPTVTSEQVNYNGKSPYDGGPKDEYRGRTVEVDRLPANGLGLHGMHGNVQEWCKDWYDAERYSSDEARDGDVACGNPRSGERVVRGGSWRDKAKNCRSARRGRRGPRSRSNFIGFRPALTLE